MNGIGPALRDLRKGRRLTQSEAAAEIGISRSTLASIESGHDLPGRDTLFALARFYGISAAEMGGGASPRRPESGEFVKDGDELALLRFWRSLSIVERTFMLRLLGARERQNVG